MFGENSDVENSLKLRKQMLIAESNLNREALIVECKRLATVTSLTAMSVAVVGFLANRAGRSRSGDAPWWQHIAKSAGVVGMLWKFFRPRGGK